MLNLLAEGSGKCLTEPLDSDSVAEIELDEGGEIGKGADAAGLADSGDGETSTTGSLDDVFGVVGIAGGDDGEDGFLFCGGGLREDDDFAVEDLLIQLLAELSRETCWDEMVCHLEQCIL